MTETSRPSQTAFPKRRSSRTSTATKPTGSTTRKFGGTGLGLAISKGLVELMGGRIGFTSDPNHGSCFWFTIPARVPSASALALATDGKAWTTRATKTELAKTAKLRVLVAEDNAVNRMLARKLLEKLGCVVDVAGEGADAVQMASRGDYDLVFMDCFMPNMDGYAAAAELRRRRPNGSHLPCVAPSAAS